MNDDDKIKFIEENLSLLPIERQNLFNKLFRKEKKGAIPSKG
jgi:hypothetical protein